MENLMSVVKEAEVQAEKIEGLAKTIELTLEWNPCNEYMYAVNVLVDLLGNHTALLNRALKTAQQYELCTKA